MSESNLNAHVWREGQVWSFEMRALKMVGNEADETQIELLFKDNSSTQAHIFMMPVEDLEKLEVLIAHYLWLRRGGVVDLG